MRERVALVFSFLLLSGCVSEQYVTDTYNRPGWFGYIEEDVSGFDGAKTIKLIPAYLNAADTSLLLGARWSTKFPSDKYALIVDVSDALNFEPAETLSFRIDDDFLLLQPVNPRDYGSAQQRFVGDDASVFSTNPVVSAGLRTTKEYWVNRQELESLLHSESAFMRVFLINDEYLEGEVETYFDGDERMAFITAKQALRRFLIQVEGIQ